MAALMKWGTEDCLTDLFGDDAHKKISWLRKDHNETLAWVLSLSESDRYDLMRSTAEGQGYVRVDTALPGDGAIGCFHMAINADYDLPSPWFAQMGVDHLWYCRMPRAVRVVDYVGVLEVYRCQRLQ